MKILALDTASDACSAALYWDGQVIERFEIIPRGHAERALAMFTELLAEAGAGVTALDGLSFGRGPGAFTGVRVAVAIIQGLAFAADLPVVGVSSLQALAQGVYRQHAQRHLACAFDARMGEVYWGVYALGDQGLVEPVLDERVCPPQQVTLPPATGRYAAVGGGWPAYAAILAGVTGDRVDTVYGDALPHAQDVAWLSLPAHRDRRGVSAAQAVPVYLRDRVVAASGRSD